MLVKECAKCKRLIPYGKSYCPDCEKIITQRREEAKAAANKKYNQRREPKYLKFYRSADWKRLARSRIQADGYKCRMCGKIATEVDHIIPIQTEDGWNKRFEWENLQSLCVECHNKKHGRFQKKNKKHKKANAPINIFI